MGARVLFRKEVTEILKTYKIYVIPLLFLVFGFASPVITKLLPDILAGLSNMEIVVPEMSWIDAFDQFFKNLNQIGIIAVILMFMGRVAEEKHRGTATMILSKPVSRTAWVIAKFGAAVLLVLLSMIPAYLACCIYTKILFGTASVALSLQATSVFAVYVIYVIGFTVGASAVMKTQVAAGGVSVGLLILSSLLLAFSQKLSRFCPGSLTGYPHSLLSGSMSLSEAFPALLSALVSTVLFLSVGIFAFERQEV